MDTRDYKELMRRRLTSAFDFEEPPRNLGFKPAVWAVHHRTTEKYFLSKKISLYTMNNDEYVCLVDVADLLTVEVLREFKKRAANWISAIEVSEDHMSSLFTLALICSKLPNEDVLKELPKLKFHKDFKFTLRGWADLAIIVVDLQNHEVYSNPKGRQNIKNFDIPES